jgi:hypothetical protein
MKYKVAPFTEEQEKQLQAYCAANSLMFKITGYETYGLSPCEDRGFTNFYIYNLVDGVIIVKQELFDGIEGQSTISSIRTGPTTKPLIKQIEWEIESLRQ